MSDASSDARDIDRDSTATADGGAFDGSCSWPNWYYPDQDEDGFGRADGAMLGCSRPSGSWATAGGDCDDNHKQVNPRQTDYFETAYRINDKESFDYDCSMSEDGSPDQPGDAPLCAGECTGSGFRPTGRSGPDVNPICGSTELVECSWLLVCSEAVSSSPAKRCR
jgi:hypothetical protein